MSIVIRDPNHLTDAELEILLQDDPEVDEFLRYLEADDDAEVDYVSDHEEWDDVIDGDDLDDIVDQTEAVVSKSNVPQYFTKNADIQWSKIPLYTRKKRGPTNIIKKNSGLTKYSSNISSISDAFFLFIDQEIINTIITETNRKANDYYHKWNANHPNKQRKFIPTNVTEIRAYIGLLLSLGALQASNEPIEMLWNTDSSYCHPIIPATMSRDRYKLLTSFLRFDNFETRLERKEVDKLAPMRDVFDMFVSNCIKSYNPNGHLCVDEQLVGFRGRCPFRVYMSSKPDKYGLKIWALADCETSYVANMQVYTGKEGGRPEKKQGKRVVLDLTRHLGAGYGITVDNFFTSMELAEALWQKKLTLCGTLRKNKPYIPTDLLPNRSRPVNSSIFAFRQNQTLVSYAPKKNKAVILLSTEHTDDKVAGCNFDYKPDMISHYNSTKGAVDTGDKLAKQYTTKRKTNRWPMTLFYHILDIGAINAFKLWILKNPNWNANYLDRRRKFLLNLGKELARENIVMRYENNKYLSRQTRQYILLTLPELGVHNENREIPHAQQGRCYICPRTKDRKSRRYCATCKRFLCSQHAVTSYTCMQCAS